MRLWTFQFPFVVRRLRRNGVYRPRWSEVKSAGPPRMLAYDWMSDQLTAAGWMVHRVPPIWAWHSYGNWNQAPGQSCANSLFGAIDQDVMRLEIEVPDNIVVISDYGAWNDIISLAFDCFRDRVPLIVPDALRRLVVTGGNEPIESEDDDEFALQACLPALYWRCVIAIRRYRIPDLDTMQSVLYDPNALD
ncbi:MAG: DUF3841 domain-containing protein [Phycisphaerales bacterium]|nr:DUF3841 domain-containing protein [Phycisphaerales bacterium]MCB9856187.1 DUF3841 domain-containing protein [Phycisphaerales bacterium]MCB9863373.1 DUF3841 domain-containing protein [Phycisphaerales bacterium]